MPKTLNTKLTPAVKQKIANFLNSISAPFARQNPNIQWEVREEELVYIFPRFLPYITLNLIEAALVTTNIEEMLTFSPTALRSFFKSKQKKTTYQIRLKNEFLLVSLARVADAYLDTDPRVVQWIREKSTREIDHPVFQNSRVQMMLIQYTAGGEMIAEADMIMPRSLHMLPMHQAVIQKNPNKLLDLIKQGFPHIVNKQGQTPLHLAVAWRQTDAAVLLVEKSTLVNAADNRNQTALHYACRFGYGDLAEILLKSGADPNCTDDTGRTPLLIAASHNHLHVMTILLHHGANSLLYDQFQNTVFHYLARQIPWDTSMLNACMEKCLAQGLSLNQHNADSYTPLHETVYWHNPVMTSVFLQLQADIDATDQDDQTALQIAKNKKYTEITLLLEAACSQNTPMDESSASDEDFSSDLSSILGVKRKRDDHSPTTTITNGKDEKNHTLLPHIL